MKPGMLPLSSFRAAARPLHPWRALVRCFGCSGGTAMLLKSVWVQQGLAQSTSATNVSSADSDVITHLGLTPWAGVGFVVLWLAIGASAVVAKHFVEYDSAPWVHWFEAFYLTGSVAYGGGQVMLPFMQHVVVKYDTICPADPHVPVSAAGWVPDLLVVQHRVPQLLTPNALVPLEPSSSCPPVSHRILQYCQAWRALLLVPSRARVKVPMRGGLAAHMQCYQVESNSTWVTEREFLTGLGIVQAMPGPLFNFSGYLGAVVRTPLRPLLSLSSPPVPAATPCTASLALPCMTLRPCLACPFLLHGPAPAGAASCELQPPCSSLPCTRESSASPT